MEHGYGYRLRCRYSAVYGALRFGRYVGLERYRLHGCHAAICWFCWRGYVSPVAAFRIAQRATACSFAAKQVFVIGGGNAACEEALFLSEIASSVTIVLRRDQFVPPMVWFKKFLQKIIFQLGTKLVLWSSRAKPCQRRSPLRTIHPGKFIPSHLSPALSASLSLPGRNPIPSLLSILSIWRLMAAF